MPKKKTTISSIHTFAPQTYLVSLFFALASVGIAVLTFFVVNNRQDIRQQAYIDSGTPPGTTSGCTSNAQCSGGVCRIPQGSTVGDCGPASLPPTSTPIMPTSQPPTAIPVIPTARPVILPTSSPAVKATITQAALLPTSASSQIEQGTNRAPANTLNVMAKPTDKPLPSTQVAQQLIHNPTSVPAQITGFQAKTGEQSVAQSANSKAESSAASTGNKAMPTVSTNTTAAIPVIGTVAKAVTSLQTNIKDNQESAALAHDAVSAFSSSAGTNSTTGAKGAPSSAANSSSVVAQTAQVIKGVVDGLAGQTSGLSAKSHESAQVGVSLSSQQAFKPTQYIPPEEVLGKVAQAAAVNTALVKQSDTTSASVPGSTSTKSAQTLNVLVQDQGKTVSHTIKVPFTTQGAVDQSALQAKVAEAVAHPESGLTISSKAIASVNTGATTSNAAISKNPLTAAMDAVTSVFGGQKALEEAKQVSALRNADLVVSLGTKPNLNIPAQQIAVNFDRQNNIVVDQTSHAGSGTHTATIDEAVGKNIVPVNEQIKSALNATPVSSPGSSANSKVVSISQSSSTAEQATQAVANKVGETTTKVSQAATIQTLAKQLGASSASVEYVTDSTSGPSNQKAFIPVSPQGSTAGSIKVATSELTHASQGASTLGGQLEQFVAASPIGKTLAAIAIPGIDKIAAHQTPETTLNVKVIHVSGDLNTQPELNLNVQSGQGKAASTVSTGAQATIIVDDVGNQKIQLSGSDRASQVQHAITTDPNGFVNLVATNLLQALQN